MPPSHSPRRPLLIDNYQPSSSLASPCHFCSLHLTCLWRCYREMGSMPVSFSRPFSPLWHNASVFHTSVFGTHAFSSIFTRLLILFITCLLWTQKKKPSKLYIKVHFQSPDTFTQIVSSCIKHWAVFPAQRPVLPVDFHYLYCWQLHHINVQAQKIICGSFLPPGHHTRYTRKSLLTLSYNVARIWSSLQPSLLPPSSEWLPLLTSHSSCRRRLSPVLAAFDLGPVRFYPSPKQSWVPKPLIIKAKVPLSWELTWLFTPSLSKCVFPLSGFSVGNTVPSPMTATVSSFECYSHELWMKHALLWPLMLSVPSSQLCYPVLVSLCPHFCHLPELTRP